MKLRGRGDVWLSKDRNSIGKKEYNFFQLANADILLRGGGALPSSLEPQIRGKITGLDFFDLRGKCLTVELEDGRNFDFFLKNAEGDIFQNRAPYMPES